MLFTVKIGILPGAQDDVRLHFGCTITCNADMDEPFLAFAVYSDVLVRQIPAQAPT